MTIKLHKLPEGTKPEIGMLYRWYNGGNLVRVIGIHEEPTRTRVTVETYGKHIYGEIWPPTRIVRRTHTLRGSWLVPDTYGGGNGTHYYPVELRTVHGHSKWDHNAPVRD